MKRQLSVLSLCLAVLASAPPRAHAADGAIAGHVVSDATGLPVAGATVRLDEAGATATTDTEGRYVLLAAPGAHVLQIEKAAHVVAFRPVTVGDGVGAAVADARLTPLPEQGVSIGTAGGVLQAGAVRITVASGAVTEATTFRLTPLTAQGLPRPLPAGWAPLAAFDVRPSVSPGAGLVARVSSVPASTPLHLVRLQAGSGWILAASGTASGGAFEAALPATGAYALVVADAGGPAAPPIGAALPAASTPELPYGVLGQATASPSRLSAAGGTSTATLTARPPFPLPSGAFVELRIRETFTLGTGAVLLGETRYQTAQVFRPAGGDGTTLTAVLPIAATRTFANEAGVEGTIHVEVWTPRPALRGSVGGADAVTVTSGVAQLHVPAGALLSNTAVAVESVSVSGFVPTASGVTPLAEVVVDLAGRTLQSAAELSVQSPSVPAGASLAVARVERVGGVPYLAVVALARSESGRVVTEATSGLPGVVEGGRYVFYRIDGGAGFVAATLTPAVSSALVRTVGTPALPFVGLRRADGSYVVAAPVGASVRVRAEVPGAELSGEDTAAVTRGATTPLAITFGGSALTATVAPGGGSVVPPTTTFDITAPMPFEASTVTTQNVRMTKVSNGAPVSLRLTLSATRRILTVAPTSVSPTEPALEWSTEYTLTATGLQSSTGAAIGVPATSFRTRPKTVTAIDPRQLIVAVPDAAGEAAISAAAGSFPAGTNVLITNVSNGVVLSLTVANDGSVTGSLRARLDHRLLVNITDPAGTTVSVERSQFFDASTGRTTVNSGGGVVEDAGRTGLEVRIPEGAIRTPVALKVSPYTLTPTDPQPPSIGNGASGQPLAQFGGGVTISLSDPVTFSDEVDVAFPVPVMPPGVDPKKASYYIYRQVRGPNGKAFYETIDQAFVEGEDAAARVVTASPPFPGYRTNLNRFQIDPVGQIAAMPYGEATVIMMWEYDALLPGRPRALVVTGKVTTLRWVPGRADPLIVPVTDELVYVQTPNDPRTAAQRLPDVPFAVTRALGEFTIIAPNETAYEVVLEGHGNPRARTYEVDRLDSSVPASLSRYVKVLRADITVAPEDSPLPEPLVTVTLMRTADDQRIALSEEGGVVKPGTPLVFGVKLQGTRAGETPPFHVTLTPAGGEPISLDGAIQPDTEHGPMRMDWIVPYAPLVPLPPRTYTVTVSAFRLDGGETSRAATFRVLTDGSSINEPVDGPPRVLEAMTFPLDKATSVAPTIQPRISFSEPVTGVDNVNVGLFDKEDGQQVTGVNISGIGPAEPSGTRAIAAVGATDKVTTITIEPKHGLKFDSKYELRVKRQVKDAGVVPALMEADYVSAFETFKPASLYRDDDAAVNIPLAISLHVQGPRAYLLQAIENLRHGSLKVYDISNPLKPTFVISERVVGRPISVSGDGNRVVVATGPNTPRPSNLYIFDSNRFGVPATIDDPRDSPLVGVVSLTQSVLDGYVKKVVVRDGVAYTITGNRGFQITPLAEVERRFAVSDGLKPRPVRHASALYRDMMMSLDTDGVGWARDSVRTIAVPRPTPPTVPPTAVDPVHMEDLAVERFQIANRMQLLLLAAASNGLVVADPQLDVQTFGGKVKDKAGHVRLTEGLAIAAARRFVSSRDAEGNDTSGDRNIVYVAGTIVLEGGTEVETVKGLAVVVVDDPAAPEVLSTVALTPPVSIADLVLHGDFALVGRLDGTTEIVNVADVRDPFVAGTIPDTGGLLALTADGLVINTEQVLFGTRIPHDPERPRYENHYGVNVASIGTCHLLDVDSDNVMLKEIRDCGNGRQCNVDAQVAFTLCRPARLTFETKETANFQTYTGELYREGASGDPELVTGPAALRDLELPAGRYYIKVPPDTIDYTLEPTPFKLTARDAGDNDNKQEANGHFLRDIVNPSMLPVGHTFVKGVDLFDGHLVRGSTDIKVRGRHLGLEVVRSYTSAGVGKDGLLGAGWSWNYASRLIRSALREPDCMLYTVITTDGGSQLFFSTDDQHFTPQKGYHTKLERAGETLVFTDKSGTKHIFRQPTRWDRPPTEWRLAEILEPHGDRIVPTYDPLSGRITRVGEYPAGSDPTRDEPVRALSIVYATIDGYDRIKEIGSNLGHRVAYTYDSHGNLKNVHWPGTNVDGEAPGEPRDETYDYFDEGADPVRDRHQLKKVSDMNGRGGYVEYEYYARTDTFPGEASTTGATFAVLSKEDYVKKVKEFDGQTLFATTFAYDYTPSGDRRVKTAVVDPRQNETRYSLNVNGSPLEIDEPIDAGTRRQTTMTWAANDIYKETETDALDRLTQYQHADGRGNLTKETIVTGDPAYGSVVTEYQYDELFNKLKYKKDPNGGETIYTIGPKGDVEAVEDAVHNVIDHHYDSAGRGLLERTVDARGQDIRYSGHNTFGDPTTIQYPLDITARITYDSRGRKTREDDGHGRVTEWKYDGHDQVIETRRLAQSPGSDDETTKTSYWPAGQPKQVKKGPVEQGEQTTDIEVDGLGRVTRTAVSGPAMDAMVTASRYDGNGNKEWERDPRGVVRTFQYDALNRLTQVDIASGPAPKPVGPLSRSTYDEVGNKLTETNLLSNRTTVLRYDGLYRVKEKELPENGPNGQPLVERYGYDKVGNPTSVTDPNDHQTQTHYDKLNRVTHVINALNQDVETKYDWPAGRHVDKSHEIDPTAGRTTSWTYDALGREATRTVAITGVGAATYSSQTQYPSPRVAVAVDEFGVTETVRDGLDRPVEVTVSGTGVSLTTTTTYDGLGNKKITTNPRGAQTEHHYDAVGRLKSVTDALSQTASTEYDAGGLKAQETDRRGIVRHFGYDNLGRLTSTSVDADARPGMSNLGWSQTIDHQDALRKRVEITNGIVVTHELDGLDRVTAIVDSDGIAPEPFRRELTYDGVGNKLTEKDRRGKTTTYSYDPLNRPHEATLPAPFHTPKIVTTYDDLAKTKTVTDRRGLETVTQTDGLGRLLTVKRDNVVIETNAYDARSRKRSSTDGEGHRTAFEYDAADRVVARIDGDQDPARRVFTRTSYPENGGKEIELDPRAAAEGRTFSQRKEYDPLGRVRFLTNGDGETSTFDYDGEGNRILVMEPTGQETHFTYEELGKLSKVTLPGGQATAYVYDVHRNRTQQIDPMSRAVDTHYDKLGRMAWMKQYPASGVTLTTSHQYDPNGNETLLTDPKGQTVTMVYDALNRLDSKAYAFASGDATRPWRHTTSIGYQYDDNGNLETATEQIADGTAPPSITQVTTRGYDHFDRMNLETTRLSDGTVQKTVLLDYYKNGARKTVGADGATTFYTYDPLARLESVTTNSGGTGAATTTYAYYPDGLTHTITYPEPSGLVATYTYDKADRLETLTNAKPNSPPVSRYVYGYDNRGNRTSQMETLGGTTESTQYTYNPQNRLETVTYPGDTSYPAGRRVTYSYDPAGNRTDEVTTHPTNATVLGNKHATFDSINRLTELADVLDSTKTITFGYDANGNQTSKTVASVTTTFGYDVRDRMVEAHQGGSTNLFYQYDFDGRMIRSSDDQGIKQYVYDQTSRLVEYGPGGSFISRFDYGSDRLIRMTHYLEGSRFYSFDGLGSVTALTDPLGASTTTYRLDAWGVFRNPVEATSSQNRFGYTGYIYTPLLKLYFAKARFYDPEAGRFTSQDSYLGEIDAPPSLHRYFYAAANPTRYVDLTGHAPINVLLSEVRNAGAGPVDYGAAGDLSDHAALALGSLGATAKVTGEGGVGSVIWAKQAIRNSALGGEASRRFWGNTAADVVDFFASIPTRYSRGLDRAAQRIAQKDYAGAGFAFTEEFTAPTAYAVLGAGDVGMRVARRLAPKPVRNDGVIVVEAVPVTDDAAQGTLRLAPVRGSNGAEAAVRPLQPLPGLGGSVGAHKARDPLAPASGSGAFWDGPPGFFVRPELPPYDGTTTVGVLLTNEGGSYPLESGDGLGPDIPEEFAAYPAAKHVEGKGGILINQLGSSGGAVFHNNPGGTCPLCRSNVPSFLPEGSWLQSVSPVGAEATRRGWTTEPVIFNGKRGTPVLPPLKKPEE